MKIFTGKVIATKSLKTATVAVERVVTHPIYAKKMKKTKKYQVHDEKGVKVGQTVNFVETRPISKTKRWRITE
jgi:small subunit ribosomal protein S17